MTRMLLRRIPVYGAQRVFHLKQNLDKYILNRFCSSSTAHIASKYENVRKLVVGLGNPGPQYTHTRHNVGAFAVEHFLKSYVPNAIGRRIDFRHDKSIHGDIALFSLSFQQNHSDTKYRYRVDDLIDRTSKRRKDKTIEEGVPHEHVNVALLLPTTFMNLSGAAVRNFMKAHQWRLKKNALSLNRQDELLVVTDDVTIPFGTCRFKAKGGSGGQNGIKDIIKCTSSERFGRLKIGIGAPEWFAHGTGAPAGFAMDKYVLGRFNAHEQDHVPALLEYTNHLLRLYMHRGLAQAMAYANSTNLFVYNQTRPSSGVPVNKS